MTHEDSGAEFAKLLVQHDRELLRYIMTFIPRRDDAEEVLQRTAAVIWEKFDEYDRSRSFVPWALRVSYFEVLNFRKEKARSKLVFSEELMGLLAETRDSQAADMEIQQAALKRCLRKLDANDSSLLWRRYGHTESVAALAQEQGKTAKSLYRRLDRLRELIARCVEGQLVGTI